MLCGVAGLLACSKGLFHPSQSISIKSILVSIPHKVSTLHFTRVTQFILPLPHGGAFTTNSPVL